MGKINVLPFSVANLIAAGEVVDRPASVIKELMENAVDAKATRVTVEIQNGGVTLMRVTDNGCGMSPEDVPVAIRRHATSKIKNAEDLESIVTLGFRGEALAAIASVSDLRILSKVKEAPMGCVLSAHCGEVVSLEEVGCSDGTTVIVENLFASVPARRKFLKKDVTEAMAVHAYVEKLALSHPEIAFRLIIDGNVKLDTVGDCDLRHTVHAVFGKEMADKLLEVNTEADGVGVHGFIGRTDNYKVNRNFENFFINGRYTKSKTCMAALEQAYTSYMPPERFPVSVLFLSVNPARVDVNVHPAKLEVKFSNEKPVFEAVYYGVRSALENNKTRPNLELNFETRKTRIGPTQTFVPVEDGRKRSLADRQLSYDLEGRTQPQPQARMTTEEYRRLVNVPAPDDVKPNAPTPVTATAKENPTPQPPTAAVNVKQTVSTPLPTDTVSARPYTPASDVTPTPSVTPTPPPAETDTPPVDYRIVGEVFNAYVIVEVGEKLLLIDKHAAHERILFEQLKERMYQTNVPSQTLMFPLEVMLTQGEVTALSGYAEALNHMGFDLRFDGNFIFVHAIPDCLEQGAVTDMLSTMAGRILEGTGSAKLTRDLLFEKALYQGACKAAIKGGRVYADGHVAWIVSKLMALPDITFCPHGRPVAMELSHKTLDNQFDRTGF